MVRNGLSVFMENNRWIGVHSPECLPWLCNVNNFAGNFFLKKTSEDTMTYYPVTIPSMWRGSPRLHHGNGIRRHSAYEQRKQRGEWSPVWVRNWGCMSSHPVSSIACYFWISWFVQPFLARTANIPTKMHSASNVCNFCFIICTFLQAHLGGSWMRDRGESVHIIEFPAAAPRAQKQHRRYCVLHMHLSAKREHLTETDAFSLNSRNGVAGSSRQHFRRLSSRAPPTWPMSSRKLILSAQVCHTCSCLNGGSVCCVWLSAR